jgi:hypothetical protein
MPVQQNTICIYHHPVPIDHANIRVREQRMDRVTDDIVMVIKIIRVDPGNDLAMGVTEAFIDGICLPCQVRKPTISSDEHIFQ